MPKKEEVQSYYIVFCDKNKKISFVVPDWLYDKGKYYLNQRSVYWYKVCAKTRIDAEFMVREALREAATLS